MAVVEYKLNIINSAGHISQPTFIREGGHWNNPADNTYVGWILDNAKYYVPDTLTKLSKEEFVQRQLSIHAVTPFQSGDGVNPEDITEPVELTEEEVRTQAEAWYDNYVTTCNGITR